MIEVDLGNPIQLEATLFDGDQTKFLRARLFDESFSQVAGSPFTLSHIQNGTYRNASFTPATEGKYLAIVEVYEDALFATLSIDYQKGEDVYRVTDREAKLDQIVSDISATQESINQNIDSNEGSII